MTNIKLISVWLSAGQLSANDADLVKKSRSFYATGAVLQKEFRRNFVLPSSVYGLDLSFRGSSKEKYYRKKCNTVQIFTGLNISLKVEDQSYTILANEVFI
jgi:hypothetical protein